VELCGGRASGSQVVSWLPVPFIAPAARFAGRVASVRSKKPMPVAFVEILAVTDHRSAGEMTKDAWSVQELRGKVSCLGTLNCQGLTSCHRKPG